jgi:hypothetical protein
VRARCSFAVFTARTDDPPAGLLADASVPRLDPQTWRLTAVDLADEDDPLRAVLSTLAFERQPPLSRRRYPRVAAYRRAVLVDVERDDSLHPDALAFAVGAVSALVRWGDGAVVDLTAERVWPGSEWAKKVARRFDARSHVSVHADWEPDGTAATLHTHGMVKFAHPDFAAIDVPEEGTRAVAQLLGHLAHIRATTLEPLQPGHAFDPGYGQPMVAFVAAEAAGVIDHLGAEPSVVVDYDVASGEAVEGLYGLLAAAKALDRPVPSQRRRWPLVAVSGSAPPQP